MYFDEVKEEKENICGRKRFLVYTYNVMFRQPILKNYKTKRSLH